MGIFKKSNKDNLFLLFPDGREAQSQDDFNELRNKYSFSPATLKDWRLHKVDIDAHSEAAGKLFSIGISSDESIIACGPVKLYEYPKSHNEYIARAILTPTTFVSPIAFVLGWISSGFIYGLVMLGFGAICLCSYFHNWQN